MGIDYRANFGLGYKIELPIDESDENTHRHTPDGGKFTIWEEGAWRVLGMEQFKN
jgi:hypothetical protein